MRRDGKSVTGGRILLWLFLAGAETRLNPALSASYFGAGPDAGCPSAGQSAPAETEGEAEIKANLAQLRQDDRQLAERQKECPVTKMPLGSMGVPVRMEVEGTVLFLCCEGCRDAVLEAPSKFVPQTGSP
jgi:hypothetical protein